MYYVNLWRLTPGHGWTLAQYPSLTAAQRDLGRRVAQVRREGAHVRTSSVLSREVRWPDAPSQTALYLVERHPLALEA